MSPDQARALLELLADLYRIASQDQGPIPSPNGQVEQEKVMTVADP